jgi:hypothetical protein
MSAAAMTSRISLISPAVREAMNSAKQPAEQSFDDLLKSASTGHDVDAVRKAATEFVSTAFIRPVLSQLRESPLRPSTGPFAANAAEKRFGPLLDERISDSVTKAAKFPLIETIVDRVTAPWKDIHVSA